MNSGPNQYDSRRARPRFVVPLENIVLPIAFIAATALAIGAHQRWLQLPFWLSVTLGVPDGILLTVFGVWLVGIFSKGRRS